MPFLILWITGIILTDITSIMIKKRNININKVLLHILVMLCIGIGAGIPVAWWISDVIMHSLPEMDVGAYMVALGLLFFLLFILYLIFKKVLRISKFSKLSRILFLVAFVLSVTALTFLFIKYYKNVETVKETLVEEKQDKELLYFCGIPVKKDFKNDPNSLGIESTKVSENITTSDKIAYWYLNEDGIGVYDLALSSASKMIFINDNEIPHVEIITYSTKTKNIDHNTGKENIKVNTGRYTEYIFYLPKYVLQYELN